MQTDQPALSDTAMTNSLLQTKILPPRVRPGFVERPRLARLLDSIDTVKMVLLSAPTGFGKSSLLSEWVRNSERDVAWVSLDEADNEVSRFFAYCAAALKTIQPEIGRGMEVMLQAAQLPSPQMLLTYLLNEVAELSNDVILVLDDYHAVTATAIHESVQFMLDYAPPQFHLVVSTRIDPPMPLARLRARGEMLEIRVRDLRFDQDEAAHLLAQITSMSLDAADVAALEDKTEGWAAGLQLAALSLRGQADASAFIQEFKGSNRFILDYLVDEVLERQSQEMQDFLLATSILERLSVPLCNAVTARKDSRALLDRLDEANLFVISLDDTQTWYRYHHLFRNALRHRLQQQPHESVAALHRRAQTWYADQGFVDETLYHAFSADETDFAAELIARHARTLLNQGAVNILHSWISRLPEAIVSSQPQLATAMAWLMAVRGQIGEVERYIKLLADHAQHSPELQAELDALRALVALSQDDIQKAIQLSEDSRQRLPDDHVYIHSLIAYNLGLAYRSSGEMAAAAQAFEDAIRLGKTSGNILSTLYALANLAALREAGGELHAVYQTNQQMVAETSTPDGQPLPLAGLGYVGLGKILREWNRLDEARAYLHEALQLGKLAGIDGIIVDSLITLALVHMGERQWENALDNLQQADQIVQRWQQPATLLRIQTFTARVRLLAGDLLVADRWRRESGVTVDDTPNDQQAIEQTMLARVLVAQGEFDTALAYITRLKKAAQPEHRVAQLIELHNLQALALARSDEIEAALASLGAALTLAQPGDYQRIFLDEGGELLALLARFAKRESPLASYAERLSIGQTSPRQDPATSPELIEQLSERELEVLGLVAAGMTNQEVATKLVIAKATGG